MRGSVRGAAAAVAVIVASVVALAPGPPPARARTPRTAPGTLELTGRVADECPRSFTCWTFTVTCAAPHDAVPPLTGSLAVSRFTAPRRGTLVAFGGGGGQDHWLVGPGSKSLRQAVTTAGVQIVAVAWDRTWNEGTTGLAALSCRPATAIAWAAARHAASGAAPTEPGACGVCVIGYSVGAGQATMAVAFHHDLADEVDAVVAVAGPATADIAAGCGRDGGPLQYLEPESSSMRRRIDDSLDGGDPSTGPCSAVPADLAAAPAWDANSLVASGRLSFPATRFSFVWGSRDRTGSVGQGIALLAALADAGTPLLGYACLDAHHDVFEFQAGVDAIVAGVLWSPADGVNVPPVPVAGISPRCTQG